ncbi:MAG: pyrroline-5-carboxylate reductase [Acetivibrionales bacterium]
MTMKVGFIGIGNMGASLVRGAIRSGTIGHENIVIFDIDPDKTKKLSKETGVKIASGSAELASECGCIVLAVKPVIVQNVLEEIRNYITDNKIIVSIAAGVTISSLKSVIGEYKKVARVMPNLPVSVGEGMTLVCFDENMQGNEKKFVKSLFEGSGKVEELEESLMSEVISLTGSSPAYVFMMIEAMADGAVLQGIPRALAYKLAAQAVLGSARMVLETGLHPGILKDQVCSPAGTTIAAVNSLEKSGFRNSLIEAMKECTRRAKEICHESKGGQANE